MYTIAQWSQLSKARDIALWKVRGMFLSPNSITFYYQNDEPVVASESRKAVIGLNWLSTSIWWNSEAKSSFEKIVAFAERYSSTSNQGRRYESLTVTAFRSWKSTHIQKASFFLRTNSTGASYGDIDCFTYLCLTSLDICSYMAVSLGRDNGYGIRLIGAASLRSLMEYLVSCAGSSTSGRANSWEVLSTTFSRSGDIAS